jgi:hypothetical protein
MLKINEASTMVERSGEERRGEERRGEERRGYWWKVAMRVTVLPYVRKERPLLIYSFSSFLESFRLIFQKNHLL